MQETTCLACLMKLDTDAEGAHLADGEPYLYCENDEREFVGVAPGDWRPLEN